MGSTDNTTMHDRLIHVLGRIETAHGCLQGSTIANAGIIADNLRDAAVTVHGIIKDPMRQISHLEEALAFQFRIAGIPIPARGYRAIDGRKFEWDFAWIESRLLLEVQGGTFARGKMGHSTGMGQHRDFEKQNLAVLAGWRVLVVDEKQIKSGKALAWVQKALTPIP